MSVLHVHRSSRISYVRKAPLDDPILEAATRMEPTVRDAFLAAVQRMKGSVNMDALAKAFASGDRDQVMAVLALDKNFTDTLKGIGLESGVTSVRAALAATFAAGAQAAVDALPRAISVAMSFDMAAPEAVSFLENYTFGLIKDITESTKNGIQDIIRTAFEEGGSPAQQAREIRDLIGLTDKQAKAVENYRTALQNGTQDALDRQLRDARFDGRVQRAIDSGTPLDADYIDKLVGRYADRYLDYRATAIARTETVRAANKGRRETWRQAGEKGLLRGAKREWNASGDSRTCDECDDLDGEVRELDEEFAPGIMEPPDPHPDCRCAVNLVFGH